MPDLVLKSEIFEEHRNRLHALAYRMLGTQSDAQDIVQEAFVRWQNADRREIRSPGAFLTKVVTNLCINELHSAHKKRQDYIGPWLPEPVITDPRSTPEYAIELADSLSMAFLRLLETLNPIERAVFLLREAFQLDYDEIAAAVDKTAANCRQIARRARHHIQSEGVPRFDVSMEEKESLMQRVEASIREEDIESLKKILAEDIAFYSDGGGKVLAARRPLSGREEVVRFLRGLRRKYMHGIEFRHTYINGEPGLILSEKGLLQSAWSFHIEGGYIQSIFAVRNPDKLREIKTSFQSESPNT